MHVWQVIPLGCLTLAFLATLWVLALWRRRGRRADPRQALRRELARAPGESQRDPIVAATWDAAEYAALAVFLPPLVLCAFPLRMVEEGGLPELPALAAFVGAALLLLFWALIRLWRMLSRAQRLALGYEAEVVAGQELDALREQGYRIYHDVPADGFDSHIDHVVVGPAGVFAVAAKGRSASGSNGDAEPWEVTYDGERLQFPGWEETLPLGQAMAQADWLCGWLANETGDAIGVRPILVLPGWSVKRTAVSGIPVLAAWRIQAYFARMRALPEMTEAMIERICEHLDSRCRVVAVVGPPAPESGKSEKLATAH